MEGKLNIAQLLMQQQRYADAEKLLKDLLTSDPNDVVVMAMYAEVNFQLDHYEKAKSLIDTAIGISPDYSILFYIKSRIAVQEDRYDDAEKHIEEAIMLDPVDADYYALWASIKLSRKQYEEALTLANKALEFDAEHILGLNTRSTALLKLNRKDESFLTIEGALREDPTNSYTHANYGWGLLERGEHKKALEHFKEALRHNPNNPNAQAGMAEALKARYIIYKYFLKYSFWLSNMTSKYQWVFIIGVYAGSKLLRGVADNNEMLRPYLTPVLFLLSVLAFSTWVMTPISNLFLRINPYGKFLLNKNEMMSSNFVGVSLVVFIVGTVSYLVLRQDQYLAVAVFGFAMMPPYSTMFSASKYKFALLIYAGLMTIIGLCAIALTFGTGVLYNQVSTVFIIAFVAYQWVYNFVAIKQSNH